MPIIRVVLAKAPDKLFLENIGTGIASKVWLQGFRYRDGNDTLRCSFDSVHKILPGRQLSPYTDVVIEQAPLGRLGQTAPAGGNMLFRAVGHALRHDRPLVLKLYVMDVLGNCYCLRCADQMPAGIRSPIKPSRIRCRHQHDAGDKNQRQNRDPA